MKYKNLLTKLTTVAITAAMVMSTVALTVSATNDGEMAVINDSDISTTEPVTEPVTEPATEEIADYTLVQQTITDKDTGVIISGMLPENAKYDVRIRMWDSEIINDIEEPNKFSDKRFSCPTFEDLQKNDYNTKGNFYDEDWINPNYLSDAGAYVPEIDIVFYDDSKIIDFTSDLTITLPFDYRAFAEIKESDNKVMVFKSIPEENTLKGMELLPKSQSPEGTLVFKTNTTGSFFVGNEAFMNGFLYFFNSSLDEVEVYESTESDDTTPTEPTTQAPTEAKTDAPTEKSTEKATEKATNSNNTSPKTGYSIPASVQVAGLGVVLALVALATMFTVNASKRKHN